jgi:hypothetical protein
VQWQWIQVLYDPDPVRHHAAASAGEDGLVVPLEVFEQVFHEHHGDAEFEARVRDIDWTPVAWTSITMSGSQLRQVGVPRPYQFAVDEARMLTIEEGLQDERPEVVEHWRDTATWRVPPVLIAGSVLGRSDGDELLVGFTRLGNLFGLIDRGEVSGSAKHRVWLGRRITA